MMRVGRQAVSGLELMSLDETIERYRAVTLDDIQRLAERILGNRPTLAVISPEEPVKLEESLSQLLVK
jgi:predicted Zn-dependent peptidase